MTEFKLFEQFPCSLLQVVINVYNLGLCVANMHVVISLVIRVKLHNWAVV